MQSPSSHFLPMTGMGVYDPVSHIGIWPESFRGNGFVNTSPSTILESKGTSNGTFGYAYNYGEETTKPTDKVQRRLAQNREAARKSRLRKKAYVQQLETSRLRLMQLEQKLHQTRQLGVNACGGLGASHLGFSGAVSSGLSSHAP